MPVRVSIDKEDKWIFPTSEWKTEKFEGEELVIDRNFYIKSKAI